MIKQLANHITPDNIICSVGLLIFGAWLLKTSWGTKALAGSTPRRNNMPIYLPFIPLLLWFATTTLAISITRRLFGDLPEFQEVLLDNIVLCLAATITTAIIIFLVRKHFVRRLKGLGLNKKTIYKDFGAAFVNLLCVWPLIMLVFILTIYVGQWFIDPDFQIARHQELQFIMIYPQISVRVLIFITAVFVIPAFEELLFRGLFQTMLRSFTAGPWLSILITSALFATIHANTGHWPTLFVLSMCIGYSYEKSGSLFRPIFIHTFFNATAVIATLSGA